jgi:hypothetical protein
MTMSTPKIARVNRRKGTFTLSRPARERERERVVADINLEDGSVRVQIGAA